MHTDLLRWVFDMALCIVYLITSHRPHQTEDIPPQGEAALTLVRRIEAIRLTV
jgi:hypothetical protein